MTNWFSDTFSSKAKENDLIAARSLNITRITAVVGPVAVGIWTGISELAEIEPFNDVSFQRSLILAFIGLIGIVTVADILGRSIATGRAASSSDTPLPMAIEATKVQPGQDVPGKVVAYRARNASAPVPTGEFLFVADTTGATTWESAADISFA